MNQTRITKMSAVKENVMRRQTQGFQRRAKNAAPMKVKVKAAPLDIQAPTSMRAAAATHVPKEMRVIATGTATLSRVSHPEGSHETFAPWRCSTRARALRAKPTPPPIVVNEDELGDRPAPRPPTAKTTESAAVAPPTPAPQGG